MLRTALVYAIVLTTSLHHRVLASALIPSLNNIRPQASISNWHPTFTNSPKLNITITPSMEQNNIFPFKKVEKISSWNTDDLDAGLSKMWTKEDPRINFELNNSSTSETKNILESDHSLYEDSIQEDMTQQELFQDHWSRLKLILKNMKGILEREFPESETSDQITFDILDKIILFVDNVNLFKTITEKFDKGLLTFLSHKWIGIRENIVNSSPFLKEIYTLETEDLANSFIKWILHGIGRFFKNNALKHLKDVSFVSTLMKSSGFYDTEISEVFKLLDMTDTDVDNNNSMEGRYYSNTFMEKSGGYGHSGGGYPSHGGYMVQTIDPFVLLAGLAFATFLAFLLYRLLSQTTGRRRSVPDVSLNLDLSDAPEVMTNLYNLLETAERKFAGNDTNFSDPIDKFSRSANNLWATFQADRMERSCMRRYLCQAVAEPAPLDAPSSSVTLHRIALTALAQLLGERGAAALLDGREERAIMGSSESCRDTTLQCDDDTYSALLG